MYIMSSRSSQNDVRAFFAIKLELTNNSEKCQCNKLKEEIPTQVRSYFPSVFLFSSVLFFTVCVCVCVHVCVCSAVPLICSVCVTVKQTHTHSTRETGKVKITLFGLTPC